MLYLLESMLAATQEKAMQDTAVLRDSRDQSAASLSWRLHTHSNDRFNF